jgi:hypothetical protein
MDLFKSTMIGYGLLAVFLAAAPRPQASQSVPPQPAAAGMVGSVGLDGSIDKFYSGTHTAIVKTADGLSHLVHLTDRTAVHGMPSDDPLRGLREGSHVVVHYVVKDSRKTAVEIDRVGEGGLRTVQGEIVSLDRPSRKLIVRLPDDSQVALRLTDRAAHDVGSGVATRTRVVVYYIDEDGVQAAHYFKKIE